LLNVYHAEESGTHIITATPDILSKISTIGKDLTAYSLETVKMLYQDAVAAGFTLDGLAPGYGRPAVASAPSLAGRAAS
jgi:hypothetical protein